MAPVSTRKGKFTNHDFGMWVGKVDDRLQVNEEFHKSLLDIIQNHHRDLLTTISNICNDTSAIRKELVEIQKDATRVETTLSVHEHRLDVVEPKVDDVEKTISNIVGKITVWVCVVSGIVTAIAFLGNMIIHQVAGL